MIVLLPLSPKTTPVMCTKIRTNQLQTIYPETLDRKGSVPMFDQSLPTEDGPRTVKERDRRSQTVMSLSRQLY